MYDKQITILSKLKKADSGVGATSDTWKKTVLTGCEYRKMSHTIFNGSTVSIGQEFVVLIPFGKGYLPYNTWKTNTNAGFSINEDDYIILADTVTETPTSETISAIAQKYKSNCCKVKFILVADGNSKAMVQIQVKGV
jgi:hypothetical protein